MLLLRNIIKGVSYSYYSYCLPGVDGGGIIPVGLGLEGVLYLVGAGVLTFVGAGVLNLVGAGVLYLVGAGVLKFVGAGVLSLGVGLPVGLPVALVDGLPVALIVGLPPESKLLNINQWLELILPKTPDKLLPNIIMLTLAELSIISPRTSTSVPRTISRALNATTSI